MRLTTKTCRIRSHLRSPSSLVTRADLDFEWCQKGRPVKFSFYRLLSLSAVTMFIVGTSLAMAQSDRSQAKPASSPAAANSNEQPVTTLSVNVKVVNVLAAVRDKHGDI